MAAFSHIYIFGISQFFFFLRIHFNDFKKRICFEFQLDDATIQVYKDGDYGAYLDLESSLAEQSEEIEGLHSKYVYPRKN